ncbi:MAG: 4'-phosphopantetheinyl transferase superfamily protein [Eubacterium sp.]|nr:4'-phosphopantetheinyl transferase superfamily protein [Eubacterium sp.]
MIYLLPHPCDLNWDDETSFDCLLPESRLQKALRYVHMSDRLLCRKAYFLLCYALSDSHQIPFGVRLSCDSHKKPYLTDYPKIHFNFAHCKDGIIVSLSSTETGADIETITSYDYRHMLNLLSASEQNLLRHSKQADTDFTAIWTLKEAYGKYRGTGIIYDLAANSFTPHYNEWHSQDNLLFYTSILGSTVYSVCRKDSSNIAVIEDALLTKFLTQSGYKLRLS